MDNLTKEQRRKNMQNIRSKNTLPEKKVAQDLKKRKVYFSQYSKKIPGKPDFIFRKKKVLVFIDSDFWHGHPDRFTMPKTNINYWNEKIKRNKERDIEINNLLKDKGWKVLRFWEYDIKKNFSSCIQTILYAIEKPDGG